MSLLTLLILALSIIVGQLIKIPVGTHGGMVLLDATTGVLCLVGLFQIKGHLKKPPEFIITALFFILIALFSLIATPLYLTTAEYLTSFFYTIRFFLYIFLGWLILSGAFTFISLKQNIHHVLLFSGVGLAILGLLQFIFLPDLQFLSRNGWDPHYFRTVSTFLDPNFLGSYLVLTLTLIVAHPKGVLNRHFGILTVLVYLALLTTFSRGAYLAFLTAFGTLSILNKSAKLGFATILLFAGLILGFSTYQRLVAQPRGIDRTQSAEFRLDTWQQGLKLFQTHPVLGVGFNTYRYALRQYDLADEKFLSSRGASSNDSSLLYVASTTGGVGLVSYLLFLSSLLRIGPQNPILLSGLLGLTIQSFFANTLFYPPLFLWIILLGAKSPSAKGQKR